MVVCVHIGGWPHGCTISTILAPIMWIKCWRGWALDWFHVIVCMVHTNNSDQDKKPWNVHGRTWHCGFGQWPLCTLQSHSPSPQPQLTLTSPVCPSLAENQAADVKYATVECFLDRGVRLAGEVGSILVGQLTTKATRKVEEPKGWWDPRWLLRNMIWNLVQLPQLYTLLQLGSSSLPSSYYDCSLSVSSVMNLFADHGWQLVSVFHTQLPHTLDAQPVPCDVVVFSHSTTSWQSAITVWCVCYSANICTQLC